jgi:uncharacterized protein with HEPN domain
MTNRLPKHLHDAVTAAARAMEFLGGLDEEAYRSNALVRSAVVETVRIDVPRLKAQLEAELARFPVP